jgi:mannose-6-phosphate isomerase-like protein (cupin superfamily)
MRQVPAQVGTLSIIGCGAQGRRHLAVALTEHPEVQTVRAYDRSRDAVQALSQLSQGRRVVSAGSASEAIEGADMVITGVTARLDPLLEADAAADDAVFLPLDYDDAIAAGVVNGATAYIVALDPGGTSDQSQVTHGDSDEFLLVLSGTHLRFETNEEQHRLGVGDSMEWRSSVPHWVVNEGDLPAELVWAISPPTPVPHLGSHLSHPGT